MRAILVDAEGDAVTMTDRQWKAFYRKFLVQYIMAGGKGTMYLQDEGIVIEADTDDDFDAIEDWVSNTTDYIKQVVD